MEKKIVEQMVELVLLLAATSAISSVICKDSLTK